MTAARGLWCDDDEDLGELSDDLGDEEGSIGGNGDGLVTTIDDISGSGRVTLDLASATATGEITMEFAISDLDLGELPASRRPSELGLSDVSIAVRRR